MTEFNGELTLKELIESYHRANEPDGVWRQQVVKLTERVKELEEEISNVAERAVHDVHSVNKFCEEQFREAKTKHTNMAGAINELNQQRLKTNENLKNIRDDMDSLEEWIHEVLALHIKRIEQLEQSERSEPSLCMCGQPGKLIEGRNGCWVRCTNLYCWSGPRTTTKVDAVQTWNLAMETWKDE